MHQMFGEDRVLKLQEKITTCIKKDHPASDTFGAMAMLKWLKDHLTSEEIDLLALIEEKAGEPEATQWLFEALSAREEEPIAAA